MKTPNGKFIKITINGQEIEIDDQIKGAWYKMINDVRRSAHNTNSCGQSDYRRCCGDCLICPWHCCGIFVSIEDDFRNNDYSSQNGKSTEYMPIEYVNGPEEQIVYEDMLAHILRYAGKVCENGDLILTMHMEKLSTSEIAKRLNIPQRTAYDRLRKVLIKVQSYYLKYFL